MSDIAPVDQRRDNKENVDVAEMLKRVADLSEEIRAEALPAEARGAYSIDLHERFREGGFYKILQPRKYGGLELSLTDYYRVMVQISRADTGIAWCVTLGTGHTIPLVAHFDPAVVDEAFGPERHFISPHSIASTGTATPVDGGFIVSNTMGYNSGAPFSTHAMVNALIHTGPREGETIVCLVPRADYTVRDDWGGSKTMALGASGSNTIEVNEVFVPIERTAAWNWFDSPFTEGTPGTRTTGNPMYLGHVGPVYHGELASVLLGAAVGAFDEFERILLTKPRHNAPYVSRFMHRDGQRQWAQIRRLIDSAESNLYAVGDKYALLGEQWLAGDNPSNADFLALGSQLYTTIEFAWEATEYMFRAVGSSVARTGHPIQRAFLALQMQRAQSFDNRESLELQLAREHFELSSVEE